MIHKILLIDDDELVVKTLKRLLKTSGYEVESALNAIEAIVSVLTFQHQESHPTINHEERDPDCDLDYVPNRSRKAKVNVILSNFFGFGSNNAVLVVRRL